MDQVLDHIDALLQQEKKYQCVDYINMPRTPKCSSKSDLVNLLEEVANVVTDKSFSSSTVEKSPSMASFQGVEEMNQPDMLEQLSSKDYRFWRSQMYDWSCLVCDTFSIDREVAAVSFSILDRYVAKEDAESKNPITRSDFQLFSMTSLYLAIKILEPYPRKLGVEALVDMSRGFYSKEDITSTENDILTSLNWLVNPPTSLAFSRLYWELLPASDVTERMQHASAALTEMAIVDGFFLSIK
jgi:hypothetical protein